MFTRSMVKAYLASWDFGGSAALPIIVFICLHRRELLTLSDVTLPCEHLAETLGALGYHRMRKTFVDVEALGWI